MSVWVDEESLDAFLESRVHRRAVREGRVPRSAVSSVRVVVPASELPLSWTWAEQVIESHLAEGAHSTSP